jgi:hypothetical protein
MKASWLEIFGYCMLAYSAQEIQRVIGFASDPEPASWRHAAFMFLVFVAISIFLDFRERRRGVAS